MNGCGWRAKLAGLSLIVFASSARAEDVKRVCIAASTLGQTLRDEGKLIDAREQMLRCAREDCPAVVKGYCGEWLGDIGARIPSIVVRVLDSSGNDRTDVRTSVDGKPLKLDGKPTSLDPGEHVVVVETPEGFKKEQRVLVVDREKSRLVAIQVPAKTPSDGDVSASTDPPEGAARATGKVGTEEAGPRRIPAGAFIVGGIGVAALGSALYFGLTARSDYDKMKTECAPMCRPEDSDAAHRRAIIADVSLGIGVAGIAGGVLWAVLGSGRGRPAPTSTRIDAAPTSGGWITTFSTSY